MLVLHEVHKTLLVFLRLQTEACSHNAAMLSWDRVGMEVNNSHVSAPCQMQDLPLERWQAIHFGRPIRRREQLRHPCTEPLLTATFRLNIDNRYRQLGLRPPCQEEERPRSPTARRIDTPQLFLAARPAHQRMIQRLTD